MEDYKQRMIEEYQQTKARYQKLHKMLVKHDAGTLDFTPACPIGLLRDQQSTMGHYLNILEIRAEIEGVDLDAKPERIADELVRDITFAGKLSSKEMPSP